MINEINIEKKYSFEIDKQINLRKRKIFYNYMKQWSAGPLKPNKTILTIIYVLSFDFQQNMPLPYIPSGNVLYQRYYGTLTFADIW